MELYTFIWGLPSMLMLIFLTHGVLHGDSKGSATDRCEEVSNPLGDHEGDHDTEAKGDVACALHDNDCQRDCCT